ncbi:MAG: flagellar basal body P-ring formation chaperone FlgA [Bacteroidota bacterium]
MRFFLAFLLILLLQGPAWAKLSAGGIVEQLTEEAKLRYQSADVEVEWKAPPLDTLLGGSTPEDLTVKVSPFALLLGDKALPLQLFRKDRLYRTIYPRIDVRVYGNALVASKTIKRGAEITAENAEVRRMSLKDLPRQPLTSLDGVLRSHANRDIPAGMALTNGLIDLPSVVKSGSMVSVQIVSGDLTVIGSGVALSDGQIGQLIKVKNPASKREFSGRVLGEGLVEVRLED